jgi:hypothetical protein
MTHFEASGLDAEAVELIENDLTATLALEPPSQFNGRRRFNVERFQTLVLFVLEKAGPSFTTALNVRLWYADFAHFRDQGISITGSQYLRFTHGPAPKSYDFLLAGMVEDGALNATSVPGRDRPGERFRAAKRPDAAPFHCDELDRISRVLSALEGKTAMQLSELAKAETAYAATRDRRPISYRSAGALCTIQSDRSEVERGA